MGSESSSSTTRNTTNNNTSQQGEANAYGENNVVNVERADAVALDNIAAALQAGVEDVTEAGVAQTEKNLEEGNKTARESIEAIAGVNRDSLENVTDLAMEVAQGAEEGTKQAMSFADNFTEREQIGAQGDALQTLGYVAAAVAVALVGVAWASKGGMK